MIVVQLFMLFDAYSDTFSESLVNSVFPIRNRLSDYIISPLNFKLAENQFSAVIILASAKPHHLRKLVVKIILIETATLVISEFAARAKAKSAKALCMSHELSRGSSNILF